MKVFSEDAGTRIYNIATLESNNLNQQEADRERSDMTYQSRLSRASCKSSGKKEALAR